ncbi:MAG: helix-turn-helix domain-containing protein [Actinomycetota bacterium]|nr:helix-turn-helix domain-containing protein [Actinomycetota bacterium]
MLEAPEAPYTNSAARAVAVVEFLASNPNQTFTLSEVARRCNLRKSTAKVVLSCLHHAGWLTRSPVDLRYGLGPMLIMIGRAADEARPEVNLARPVMLDLSLRLHCECVLNATTGGEIVILESTAPGGLSGRYLASGQRGPFVAPYGAVFVAWRSRADRSDWYNRPPGDPNRIGQLDQILDECVKRGYVVTIQSDPRERMMEIIEEASDQLTTEEIRVLMRSHLANLSPDTYLTGRLRKNDRYLVNAVQAPIFDARGIPAFALSVHIGRTLDGTAVAELGQAVRLAAGTVTAVIADHAPYHPTPA